MRDMITIREAVMARAQIAPLLVQDPWSRKGLAAFDPLTLVAVSQVQAGVAPGRPIFVQQRGWDAAADQADMIHRQRRKAIVEDFDLIFTDHSRRRWLTGAR